MPRRCHDGPLDAGVRAVQLTTEGSNLNARKENLVSATWHGRWEDARGPYGRRARSTCVLSVAASRVEPRDDIKRAAEGRAYAGCVQVRVWSR
jgi:hypothetical protein